MASVGGTTDCGVFPVRLDITVDGSMICSTFAARVWEHAGVTLQTLNPMTTTPADLKDLVYRSRMKTGLDRGAT